MNKYNTHSDLAKESLDLLKEGKHYQRKIEKKEDFSIETYEFLEDTEYLKKGKYIEFFFKDHISNISEQITKILKEMIDQNEYPRILVTGLGNPYLTSDAIGPRTLRDIRVTHYLDDGLKLENHYYDILSLTPGVMYQTGVETVEVIQAMVEQFQIDLVIVIDALCAKDYQKLGHVIQINNVGIHPGSGIGNHRQAIQEETLGCPVIAIGVPTVIYASSIVRDVFQLMKDYFGDAIDIKNRLKIGKREKYEGTLSSSQQRYLLGHIGSLDQEELESLLQEILTPVDRNFVMSDKQIDETVERMSALLAKALNDLRYNS